MAKKRKQYTVSGKVAILRQHLLDGTPVSDICDQCGLQPTVFYSWQKQFFEQGAGVFEQRQDAEGTRLECQVK